MKRPFVGIGHSMGGNNLTNLALMHPRLFESLILIDPVMAPFISPRGNVSPAHSSATRRDRWPSRQVALESFKRSKFYQAWDPRVLDLWIKYGLRELPTKLYPDAVAPTLPYDSAGREVTLTTTKHQEVFTFLRPVSVEHFGPTEGFSKAELAELKDVLYPDLEQNWKGSFYRPEPVRTFENLKYVRPSVLYLFGETSPLSALDSRTEKLSSTGIGLGGSGGVEKGRVKDIIIKDTGHLIPMEKVTATATSCAGWIASEMRIWARREALLKRLWDATPDEQKYTLERRMDMFGPTQREKRPKPKM
jgi:pimeloyl-ACP methyl ester carboxylesterase